MTILTSILNAGLAISYAISSSVTDGLDISCIEDPDDANNVICDFDNLWIMVIIVNLTTLIPLVLIGTLPNEQALQELNDKLQTASNAMGDEVSEQENAPDKDEMIGIYWFCVDRIFPTCKCKCCDKNNKIDLVPEGSNMPKVELEARI